MIRFQAASRSESVTPYLLEAGDCIPPVSSVMDGFFTLFGESEVLIGDMIAASVGDVGHAS